MLKAGMKPIQVESKLADMDPAVRPLLSQIQGLNKMLKKVYPNMDTGRRLIQVRQHIHVRADRSHALVRRVLR